MDLILDQTTTEWEHSADFGVHDIEIQLLNKQINDTVLDNNGNIISDMFVIIESLKVNDIDFKNQINALSYYTDPDGNYIETFGYLGFTTPYKMILQTPGYMFQRNLNILDSNDLFSGLSESINK